MRKNNLLNLLSSSAFITINKSLMIALGLQEAILLSELIAEYNYWEETNRLEDDMFFSTVSNIEKNTTLSDYQQRTALKHLEEDGLLTIIVKGLPAKRYIKLNYDALYKLLSEGEVKKENKPKEIKETSKNLKDIYTTIHSYDMPKDVKDELINFYTNKAGQYTVKQVKDNIDDIYQQCNGNWQDILNSVHQAYLSNWGKFYFNKSNNKQTTQDTVISKMYNPANITNEVF